MHSLQLRCPSDAGPLPGMRPKPSAAKPTGTYIRRRKGDAIQSEKVHVMRAREIFDGNRRCRLSLEFLTFCELKCIHFAILWKDYMVSLARPVMHHESRNRGAAQHESPKRCATV